MQTGWGARPPLLLCHHCKSDDYQVREAKLLKHTYLHRNRTRLGLGAFFWASLLALIWLLDSVVLTSEPVGANSSNHHDTPPAAIELAGEDNL